ncbi:hypothetical protein TRVL_06481 [Trypanosoma vivax]|nr:hypothetical protein TRVL_06481 [Trypanosoma vivax]
MQEHRNKAHSGVKALHLQRDAIKQRILQEHAKRRTALRQQGLRSLRSQEAGMRNLVGNEFCCDLNNPDVVDFLIQLEEEVRDEQLLQFYNDAYEEDWEMYYNHLCPK